MIIEIILALVIIIIGSIIVLKVKQNKELQEQQYKKSLQPQKVEEEIIYQYEKAPEPEPEPEPEPAYQIPPPSQEQTIPVYAPATPPPVTPSQPVTPPPVTPPPVTPPPTISKIKLLTVEVGKQNALLNAKKINEISRSAHLYSAKKLCENYNMGFDETTKSCIMTKDSCELLSSVYDFDSTYTDTVEWHPEVQKPDGSTGECIKVKKFYKNICSGVSKGSNSVFDYVPGKYQCFYDGPDSGLCKETTLSTCKIPSEYCRQKGVSYSSEGNGDCYVNRDQENAENLFGTTLVRKLVALDPSVFTDIISIPSSAAGRAICEAISGKDSCSPNFDLISDGRICDLSNLKYTGIFILYNLYDPTATTADKPFRELNPDSGFYPYIRNRVDQALIMLRASVEDVLTTFYGAGYQVPGFRPYTFLDYMITFKDKNCKSLWRLTDLFRINFYYVQRPDCSNPLETLIRMISQVVFINLELRYLHTIAVNPDTNPATNYELIWKNPDPEFKLNIPVAIRKTPGSNTQRDPLNNTKVQLYSLDYMYLPTGKKVTNIPIARYQKDYMFCNKNLYNFIEENKSVILTKLNDSDFVKQKNNWLNSIFGSIPASISPLRFMNEDKVFYFQLDLSQTVEADSYVIVNLVLTATYRQK